MNRPAALRRDLPHVVIVGAGFGGLAAARALGGAPLRVTLVDRRNHHLFVPLLYQVATAALSPSEIAEPIRHVLRRHDNMEVLMDEVVGVDPAAKTVQLAASGPLAYDRLVLATGSQTSWFGHPEWRHHAAGLRSVEDARAIRARLLTAFERAEICQDEAERQRLLTILVVGGGATGVELAGAIAELARHALSREFRRIDPTQARILLVEAGKRLLPNMPEALSEYAKRALERLGVEVRLETMVESIDSGSAMLSGERLAVGTLLWAAGVSASPAARWLGVEADRGGRVPVDPTLAVPGLDGVYVIGDSARVEQPDGGVLPGLAQVAKQQGEHLGRELRRALAGGSPAESKALAPFRFRNRGDMATIGRNAAVADFGRFTLSGRLAWLLWGIVHVYLLVGFENRLVVSLRWFWAWLTRRRGVRLITREPEPG